MSNYKILGKGVPRKDAIEKVNGQAKYVHDIKLPGMLYASYLRSPHANARIKRIDTSKAEALQGVRCILTYKDVPRVHPRNKIRFLLDEFVHCSGDEVASVAATTKEIADQAVKLIKVDYEVLPAVFNAEKAMQPDAPLVYPEYGTNMYHGTELQPVPSMREDHWLPLEHGDLEKGFAEADYVIEERYETPAQYHCSPLPRAVICEWVGEKLTCYACSQKPMMTMQDLAVCLDMPESHVRVVSTYVVGGYGGKEPEEIAVLTAIMAKKTGKPVQSVLTREEDFVASRHRSKYVGFEKIGVKKDGTITAMQHRMIHNFGKDNNLTMLILANSGLYGGAILYPYASMKFEGCSVITNIPEHGSMNGYGSTESVYMIERIVDEAAEKTGIDPVEFRLKNCMRYGTRGQTRDTVLGRQPHGTPQIGKLGPRGVLDWGVVGKDADAMPICINEVAEKSQWKKKWKGWKTPVSVNGHKRRGIGISLGINGSAYWNYSSIIKMNHDGTATVMSGATELGQNCSGAMAQVVCEVLGMRYEDVYMHMADTAVTPAGVGNVGSCGTSSAITAAKNAAEDIKQKLFDIAAPRLGVKPEDLDVKDSMIFVKSNSQKQMPIAEACAIGYQVVGVGNNRPYSSFIDEKSGKRIYDVAVAATIAEVEVDTETGQVDTVALYSAHDAGTVINSIVIENQIDLSMVMSNGWVRSENYVIDESTGVVVNPNLLDYKLMTILDMPKIDDIKKSTVEIPCAWGPYGAKGMSETATTSQAAAIANAVYNAIGVRMRGDVITPDKVLMALNK